MSIKGCKGKKVTETTQISNIYAETNCTKKMIRDGIKDNENAASTHTYMTCYNSKKTHTILNKNMVKWRNRITDQFKTFTTKVKKKSEMINIPTISGFESTFAKKKKGSECGCCAMLPCAAEFH